MIYTIYHIYDTLTLTTSQSHPVYNLSYVQSIMHTTLAFLKVVIIVYMIYSVHKP
jgi:hypothetical protein